MWKQDVMSEHCGGSLSDALAVSNESLAKNNSTAFQFLDHLTANSIFVNKLVANDAFIKNLFAENIKATGSIRVGERYDENGNVVTDEEGQPLDVSGAYIGGDGTFKANKAVLTNIEAEGGDFNNINVKDLHIANYIKSDNYGITEGFIIQKDGYVNFEHGYFTGRIAKSEDYSAGQIVKHNFEDLSQNKIHIIYGIKGENRVFVGFIIADYPLKSMWFGNMNYKCTPLYNNGCTFPTVTETYEPLPWHKMTITYQEVQLPTNYDYFNVLTISL